MKRGWLVVPTVATVLTMGALSGCGEPIHGTVTDKAFTPGGCTNTVVIVNGKSGVAVTCTADRWTLVIATDKGETEVTDVDEVTYIRTAVGDRYDEDPS